MQRPSTQWEISTDRVPTSIDEILDLLLAGRGLDRASLTCRLEDVPAHGAHLRGLDDAAARVARVVREGRRLLLVGDYDCDGLTSIAQLALFLRSAGFRNFAAETPASRAEGYGVPLAIIRANPDADLLVALDCGTHDREAIAAARAQGAEVVVIDHHAIPDAGDLAPATVLVNPQHPDCSSPFKAFATAGLTLLFLTRLHAALGPDTRAPDPLRCAELLALAAVGTVADVMPLIGPNRILVRHGLAALAQGRPAPLQALREVAGIANRAPDAGQIGFQIGPRLNAAARMEEAGLALRLLLSEDRAEIQHLAHRLDALNARRQDRVEAIFATVRQTLAGMAERRTVVLADPSYPLGVNGILAQRVAREVHRPAIVMQAFPEEGIATGSARSIPGFDLFGALTECRDLLTRWGGHAMAAGATLRLTDLERFRERLEKVAQARDAGIFQPRERADLELPGWLFPPDDGARHRVLRELLDALRQLEPHGLGNPAPRFALRDREVRSPRAFGRGGKPQHLEIMLDNGLSAILWGGATGPAVEEGERVDLIGTLDWDEYRGAVRMIVKDLGRGLLAGGGGDALAAGAAREGEGLAAQGFEPRTRGL